MNKRIIFFTGIFFIIAESFLVPSGLEAMDSPHNTCKTVYDEYRITCQHTQQAKKWLTQHKEFSYTTTPAGRAYVNSYNRLARLCYHSQTTCSAFPQYLINSTMPGCVNSTIQIEYILNCDRPERPALQG